MNRYLQQSAAAADGNRIGSSPVPSLRFLHCYTNIQLTRDICSSLEMAVSGARGPRRHRRLSRDLVSRPGRRESDAPAVSAPALQTGTGTGCSVDHSVDWVRSGDRARCDPLAVMQHTLLIQIFRIRDDRSPEAPVSLSCPTCAPWSDVCCQVESGPRVLGCLVRANTRAVWNTGLMRALARLRYQVSVGVTMVTSNEDVMCRVSCVRGCWSSSPMIRGSRSSRRVNIAPCCSPQQPQTIAQLLNSLLAGNSNHRGEMGSHTSLLDCLLPSLKLNVGFLDLSIRQGPMFTFRSPGTAMV